VAEFFFDALYMDHNDFTAKKVLLYDKFLKTLPFLIVILLVREGENFSVGGN